MLLLHQSNFKNFSSKASLNPFSVWYEEQIPNIIISPENQSMA
jgi:hypothetical protein